VPGIAHCCIRSESAAKSRLRVETLPSSTQAKALLLKIRDTYPLIGYLNGSIRGPLRTGKTELCDAKKAILGSSTRQQFLTDDRRDDHARASGSPTAGLEVIERQ
jgi:hypothetical protein